jgi:hypothetical protein
VRKITAWLIRNSQDSSGALSVMCLTAERLYESRVLEYCVPLAAMQISLRSVRSGGGDV